VCFKSFSLSSPYKGCPLETLKPAFLVVPLKHSADVLQPASTVVVVDFLLKNIDLGIDLTTTGCSIREYYEELTAI